MTKPCGCAENAKSKWDCAKTASKVALLGGGALCGAIGMIATYGISKLLSCTCPCHNEQPQEEPPENEVESKKEL